MNISEFLKYEISGWSRAELFGLFSAFVIILTNSIIFSDSKVAVLSAICGILYTIISGKGKISCYLFGLIGTCCYVYLSYKNALYGHFALNLFYYLPMEIVGIVEWKKHLRKENREIYKTELSVLDRNKIVLWSILLSALSVFILILLKDSSPFIDGITTSLSIIGMYLTVKRCIEQWLVWCVVNFLSIIMWCKLVLCGSRTISTIVMWSVYFLLGIYFYQAWRKELSIQSNQ